MTSPAPVRVHVSARGNGFMTDIAEMLREAAEVHRPATLVTDELPANDGAIHLVVAPHEFFELFDAPAADLQRAAAASVCVGTEQPGTPWFHLGADACRRGLLTLDINPVAVESLRHHGIDAAHLQLGAVPSMDSRRRGRDDGDRPLDVLFMGGLDDRRGRVLAELAIGLHERHCDLRLFRFDRPVRPGAPGVVFGRQKFDLLASARVLLNVHRQREEGGAPYFEWVRMIEAMANGCAIVSESSTGYEPLVEGLHFLAAGEDDLGECLLALLADEPRRRRIAEAAHEVVTEPLELASTIGPVLDAIDDDVLPALDDHLAAGAHRRGPWRFHGEVGDPVRRLTPFAPYAGVQRAAKQLALAESHTLRRIDAARCLLRHGARQHVERLSTPAYADAEPEVTTVVTVYDYADVVTETLDSLAASGGVRQEIVVVDDHATDDSRVVVRRWMDHHPDVPVLLLGRDANQGLAAARNLGFTEARADLVMVMDADNLVYPTCLARLRDTLQADPGAAAAYAILEDFGAQRNVRSALDWDPRRLCQANYIDAQAMWRRDQWEHLGGYRADDDHVFGWEDWDLWLRLADRGGHAVLRREILGRYRVQAGSMIALTNLATGDAIEALRRRYPGLPWPPAG